MTKTKKLLLASLFLATAIIFSRFLSIKTPILTIGFSFIPIMMCAILLDWKWTILVSGLCDLIGALLFPFGTYFVGYTISAIISGLIYGLIINRQNNDWSNKKFILRLIIATTISLLFVNGCLNTLWIYITSKSAFNVIVPIRIIKQLIMLPIQVTIIFFLYKLLPINKLYLNRFSDTNELDSNEQVLSINDGSKHEETKPTKNNTKANVKNSETNNQKIDEDSEELNKTNTKIEDNKNNKKSDN